VVRSVVCSVPKGVDETLSWPTLSSTAGSTIASEAGTRPETRTRTRPSARLVEIDDEVRQLCERYLAADGDTERHAIALKMGARRPT